MWSAFVPHSLLARTEFDAQKRPVNAHLFHQHTPTVSRSAGMVIRLVVLRSRKFNVLLCLWWYLAFPWNLAIFRALSLELRHLNPTAFLWRSQGTKFEKTMQGPCVSRAVPDSWHLYTSWALRARAAFWEMMCHSVGQGLVAHQSERHLAPFCHLGKWNVSFSFFMAEGV